MKRFRDEKGFTGTDVIIAIVIITIFSGIVISLGYNIYLVNEKIKRAGDANNYIISIMEEVDRRSYTDVTLENLENLFETDEKVSINDDNSDAPYKISVYIKNYKEAINDVSDEEYLDLVKLVIVSIRYKVGNQEQQIEISRVKKNESVVSIGGDENG